MVRADGWRARMEMAKKWRDAVNKNGGDVTLIHLPTIGIKGNTHFPFSDLNNIQIADLLSKWLKEKAAEGKWIKPARSEARTPQPGVELWVGFEAELKMRGVVASASAAGSDRVMQNKYGASYDGNGHFNFYAAATSNWTDSENSSSVSFGPAKTELRFKRGFDGLEMPAEPKS